MADDQPIGELHCLPCGPVRRSRSYGGVSRPRIRITGALTAVFGQTTVFSLPHACLANGLLKGVGSKVSLGWADLASLANKQWESSVENFFSDAQRLGVTPDTARLRGDQLAGAIIGWTDDTQGVNDKPHPGICPDLELTVAILSRRVGNIFISRRDPDYSWDALFGSMFLVDDDIGPAPKWDSDPWKRYLEK